MIGFGLLSAPITTSLLCIVLAFNVMACVCTFCVENAYTAARPRRSFVMSIALWITCDPITLTRVYFGRIVPPVDKIVVSVGVLMFSVIVFLLLFYSIGILFPIPSFARFTLGSESRWHAMIAAEKLNSSREFVAAFCAALQGSIHLAPRNAISHDACGQRGTSAAFSGISLDHLFIVPHICEMRYVARRIKPSLM